MLAILEALVCDFFATCHNISVVAESLTRFLPLVRFAGLSESVYELGLWVLSPYLMQFREDFFPLPLSNVLCTYPQLGYVLFSTGSFLSPLLLLNHFPS